MNKKQTNRIYIHKHITYSWTCLACNEYQEIDDADIDEVQCDGCNKVFKVEDIDE